MASSRQMRRSGLSTANPISSDRNKPSRKEDKLSSHVDGFVDEWEEPPLRTPVPSYEDYKGLERHGVLEHMAALGAMPTSRVKARVRQYEPSRRAGFSKNGEAKVTREELSTPEPAPENAPALPSRPPAIHTEDTRPASPESQRGPPAVNPSSLSVAQTSTLPVPPPAPTPRSLTPPQAGQSINVSTPTSRSRMKGIVEAACQRSDQLGNPALGGALQQVYEDSLHDPTLVDLVDAVLTHKTSPEQQSRFQSYIKAAAKALKKKQRASISVSHSPAANTSSNGATRQLEQSQEPTTTTNQVPPDTVQSPSKPSTSDSTMNSSSPKDVRPTKRVKRSLSASSESSLSSLDADADIEDYAPAKLDATLPKISDIVVPKLPSLRFDAGPLLGSFSTSNVPVDPIDPEEMMAARRRHPRGWEGYRVNDSHVRSSQTQPTQPKQPKQPPTALQQRAQQPRRNGVVPRSRRNEDNSRASPVSSQGELLLPPPPGPSRGITPQLGRPPKLGRKASRIKQSPLKKRNGVVAGVAQSAEAGPSNAAGGRNGDHSPDPEACSACGGGGKTVICDGCSRGYHLTCCDPPFSPETVDDDLPAQWLCWNCTGQAHDEAEDLPSMGLFAGLKQNIRFKDPTAFNLPRDIRNYFEGVKTGEEGEYEDMHNVKIVSKARQGYDETPDNLRLKDRKDNTILCFKCGGSSMGKRELVPCDYCTLCWHLDCLDPPRATAPNKKPANGRSRPTWMCPNHVDHELANVKASATRRSKGSVLKSTSNVLQENQRTFRTRRPKNASIVQTAVARGQRNNGLIEIEEEQSEEESEIEREMSGVIYKVPEHGIKLDFIDRIKRSHLEAQVARNQMAPRSKFQRKSHHIQTAMSDAMKARKRQVEPDPRPFKERKAALNLAQMAQRDGELNPDKVANLIDTLTAEAPVEVEKLLETAEKDRAASEPVSEQEKKDLQALIALAQKRLGA